MAMSDQSAASVRKAACASAVDGLCNRRRFAKPTHLIFSAGRISRQIVGDHVIAGSKRAANVLGLALADAPRAADRPAIWAVWHGARAITAHCTRTPAPCDSPLTG
jgi:hypothetical protein